jgi:hypothetical protein
MRARKNHARAQKMMRAFKAPCREPLRSVSLAQGTLPALTSGSIAGGIRPHFPLSVKMEQQLRCQTEAVSCHMAPEAVSEDNLLGLGASLQRNSKG